MATLPLTPYGRLILKAAANKVYGAEEKPPMCLHVLGQGLVAEIHRQNHRLWKAAAVLALDPKIREWLEKNDRKALHQLLDALADEEE